MECEIETQKRARASALLTAGARERERERERESPGTVVGRGVGREKKGPRGEVRKARSLSV